MKEKKILNWDLYKYQSIDSTNEEAKRLLQGNINKNFIVIAALQTVGKGRLGRSWISPLNTSLYGSWVVKKKNKNLNFYSLIVALCCVKAVNEITNKTIKIKWPNDLYYNKKKLGGILIEILDDFLIVGIGINIIRSKLPPKTAISIEEIINGSEISFQEYLNNLILNITKYIDFYILGNNINEKKILKEIYQCLTTPINKSIEYIKDNAVFDGVLSGISENGELIIKNKNNFLVFLRDGEISLLNK